MIHIDMEFHVLFKDEFDWYWWDHADANDAYELVDQYRNVTDKQIVKVNYVDGSTAYVERSK